MYSLAASVTLAALTIASAASTDPIRPLVSTSPSASAMCRGSYHLFASQPSARMTVVSGLPIWPRETAPLRRFAIVVMVGLDFVRRRLPRQAVRAGLVLAVASAAACGGKDDVGAPLATPTVT